MPSAIRFLLPMLLAATLSAKCFPAESSFARDTTRELNTGDMLPDLELVNQLGEPIRVSAFRGKPLALTFIYSRCSSATLCPLMSRNFDIAQSLLTRLGASEGCHLLSISLDAKNDTPEVLAAYARGCSADEKLWTFATAPEQQLRSFGNSVGLEFKRTGEQIDHNLRTVVVDAGGRIRHIFRGNAWTAQELVAELRRATLAPSNQ
jgi:protein SCO1/2